MNESTTGVGHSPQCNAIYIVTTDIDEPRQPEFNRWYDEEHLADVSSKPGVRSGMRYVADIGWPRYLALYELENCATVDHPSFELLDTHPSDWSLRMSPAIVGKNVQRYLAELVFRGDDLPSGSAFPPQLCIERSTQAPTLSLLEQLTAACRSGFVRHYKVLEGNAQHLLMYEKVDSLKTDEGLLAGQISGSPCRYRAGKMVLSE